MAKRRIIIKGNVQGVGYRAFVRWFANDLGVTGRVKNLSDRSVEIYCEGDAKVLEDFIRAIDVKSKDMHMLKMNVKSMTIHEEGTKEYFSSKAPKRSQDFKIYYGAGLKKVDRETMERDEITVLAAQDLSKSIDGVTNKVDVLGQKVGTGFKELGHKVEGVGQNVQSMHGDMNKSFIEMDGRYHSIGENLEKMNENVKGLTDAIKELVEDNNSEKHKRKDQGTGQT
jgi:acylphosphatase